ncbi:transposase [Brucella vulpis]|nr:transposase [Brucella vulpis]CUW51582.1 transposase [Brucella vulpis]
MTVNFTPGDLVRARGREWVALPTPAEGLLALRPLSGNENDIVVLAPDLELAPVEAARFDLPDDARTTVQSKAALLADALRLTLRRGAGPFRSAAQLAFEPRTYQLVPLLMALRLQVPRLLIADDVCIGKTIEAGLILRELKDRFGIDAVAVTSGTAARLERNLPLAQTLFDAYPFTVVSLDYIKAEKRRDGFARACPDFVIVDEAHACVGTHKGKQQRFDLLQGLARDPDRRLILLTATPHSGDEDAFARLLSLIDMEFGTVNFDNQKYRERLVRHFVQRRRVDLVEGDWDENRSFPKHETTEYSYRLNDEHRSFQEAVLDYCFSVVSRAGDAQKDRRLAFWGTLALMRCVGSSPAAAMSALRNRASNEDDRLAVSFQEVVHSERIEETGVTIPQFSRIAPNEHPQECQTDTVASRSNGGRSSRRQADEGAGCTPLWRLAENCFSLDRTVQDIWPGGDDGSLVAPHPQPPSNGPGHCRTDTPSSQTTPDR